MAEASRKRAGAITALAIVAVSALLGVLAAWRTPGVDLYTRDLLMRARGVLPAPDDIAIVAIDEASMGRFGRFPWPRSVMARAVQALAAGQPKAIAIDVLVADPSVESEDQALEAAIGAAGNVVVAAQLIDAPGGGPAAWLDPLPPVARRAAAVGHVNVLTESEGVARALLIRAADDAGRARYALPVETLRVGERLSAESIMDNGRAVLVGSHVIPAAGETGAVLVSRGAVDRLPARRMAIDYIGPANSFAASTYSIADVVEGRVQASTFRGRYVLIGATAASMGDRLTSPFVHHADVQGNQHGSLMPGVEVLANALNTILRGRFYRETSGIFGFLWTALAAALTLAVLALSQGRFQGLKQIGGLVAVGAGILLGAYLGFVHLLLILPVTSGVVAVASAGILGLTRRSLVTSARLDEAIAEMAAGQDVFAPPAPRNPAESIVRLTGVTAAAVFDADGRPLASWGKPARAAAGDDQSPRSFFNLPADDGFAVTVERVGESRLVLLHPAGQPPAKEAVRLAAVVAALPGSEPAVEGRGRWPRAAEDKARALGRLNTKLLDRARFVDSALRSVDDGLIIAAPDGRIHFANSRAAAILGAGGRSLIGHDLLERLAACDAAPDAAAAAREMLARVLIERTPAEREISVRGSRPRQYVLRLAAVGDSAGFVATFSDITRQKELHQTKNDVIALVSHEMRTPLTAIQGMSEVLANYDVDPARRKEINLAINDEAKRLTRMITEYLDITRLESGATVMHPLPVRVETVLERTLVLLDPVAAGRGIRLIRNFGAEVPPIVADADLLARAVQNLVANAVKYSAQGTEVRISTRGNGESVAIDVADQGYGIPESDLERIFDKFYRVPRASDADAPGTGLGLALAREIAELHGGSVSVRSKVGVGSVFTMVLPKAGATG
jgi:PAS domain S-box-containing protein